MSLTQLLMPERLKAYGKRAGYPAFGDFALRLQVSKNFNPPTFLCRPPMH